MEIKRKDWKITSEYGVHLLFCLIFEHGRFNNRQVVARTGHRGFLFR